MKITRFFSERKEQCFHQLSSEGVAFLELYLEIILTVYYRDVGFPRGLQYGPSSHPLHSAWKEVTAV